MAKPSTPTGLVVVNELDMTNARRSESNLLTWTANTETNIVKYNVYRNYMPYGTFLSIGEVVSPIVTYTDDTTLTTTPFMPGDANGLFQTLDGMWYYRVSAVNDLDEESDLTDPISYIESEAYSNDTLFSDGYSVGGIDIGYSGGTSCDMPGNDDMLDYFNQIRDRKIWLLLQNGQEVWLYKRRQEGTKCPHWNDIGSCSAPLGTKINNYEDACYGTGYIGGYYDPVKINIRYISSISRVAIESAGMRVDNKPKGWTIWTPNLSNMDFIITQDGHRYEIMDVNPYRVRGGLITHQDFSLIRKWKGDFVSYVPGPTI